MSDNIWPRFAYDAALHTPDDAWRQFQCILLMPIGQKRFDTLADVLTDVVHGCVGSWLPGWPKPQVDRLDWVKSGGTIHHQLWERIATADLIICDLTGQNANVLFEAGVCAAWKRPEQVIFLRDTFYKPEQPFDIQPYRYLTYELTAEGVQVFVASLQKTLEQTVARFPERLLDPQPPPISLPLTINFRDGRDDLRLLTPPLSHRRVANEIFEFGTLLAYPHSWASIGKQRLETFTLECDVRFTLMRPDVDRGFIGVGFLSQNVLVPFCHALGLHRDGSIVLAQPDESAAGYHDVELRGSCDIDLGRDHHITVAVSDQNLTVGVDDFQRSFSLDNLPTKTAPAKKLGPGLIRFQCSQCRMGIRSLSLSAPENNEGRAI